MADIAAAAKDKKVPERSIQPANMEMFVGRSSSATGDASTSKKESRSRDGYKTGPDVASNEESKGRPGKKEEVSGSVHGSQSVALSDAAEGLR